MSLLKFYLTTIFSDDLQTNSFNFTGFTVF
jgi:hypothetical protein